MHAVHEGEYSGKGEIVDEVVGRGWRHNIDDESADE